MMRCGLGGAAYILFLQISASRGMVFLPQIWSCGSFVPWGMVSVVVAISLLFLHVIDEIMGSDVLVNDVLLCFAVMSLMPFSCFTRVRYHLLLFPRMLAGSKSLSHTVGFD